MTGEQELDTPEKAQDALEAVASMRAAMGLEDTEGVAVEPPLVAVKQEPGEPSTGAAPSAGIEPPGDDSNTNPNDACFKMLQTDAKRVLRNVADALTNMKEIYTECADQKFTSALQEELAKVIPQFASLLVKVERVVVHKEKQPDILLALAKGADELFESYNTCATWYRRINPKSAAKKIKLA